MNIRREEETPAAKREKRALQFQDRVSATTGNCQRTVEEGLRQRQDHTTSPSKCRPTLCGYYTSALLHLAHHGRWKSRSNLCSKSPQVLTARFLQNKRLSKGKKGIKKKVVDPFSRKGMSPMYYKLSSRSNMAPLRLVRHQGSFDF